MPNFDCYPAIKCLWFNLTNWLFFGADISVFMVKQLFSEWSIYTNNWNSINKGKALPSCSKYLDQYKHRLCEENYKKIRRLFRKTPSAQITQLDTSEYFLSWQTCNLHILTITGGRYEPLARFDFHSTHIRGGNLFSFCWSIFTQRL